MPSEDTKKLEFNQYHKSDKAPYIIYADLEYLIEKTDGFKQNPESSFTTKDQVLRCQQYHHLKTWITSMMYTEVKIARESFVNLKQSMKWR